MALKLKPSLPRVPRAGLPLNPEGAGPADPPAQGGGSTPRIQSADEPLSGVILVARTGVLALLAYLSWTFLTVSNLVVLGTTPQFFHGIHLVFHEAGHVLLMWAPHLVMSAGGTLGQLFVPLILAIAFGVKYRNAFAAAVCVWWLGHSLVDCAPYINDARAMQLQLLGGGTGNDQEGHDWNYMLGELGWLSLDVRLARVTLLIGRTVMIAGWGFAVGWMVWDWLRTRKRAAA